MVLFISEKRISSKTAFTVDFAEQSETDEDEEAGKRKKLNL